MAHEAETPRDEVVGRRQEAHGEIGVTPREIGHRVRGNELDAELRMLLEQARDGFLEELTCRRLRDGDPNEAAHVFLAYACSLLETDE